MMYKFCYYIAASCSNLYGENSCEIKGGSQQMAAMMLILINFNNAQPLLNFISINIFAAICWLPSLIHNFFHPGF